MTRLLFLEDTYLSECAAVIEAIGSDERGTFATLDETVFYPQGGGQPTDLGALTVDGLRLNIKHCGFTGGQVRHYLEDGSLSAGLAGKAAHATIDRNRRLANARLHTAGHLVSHVLETIESALVPIKGYHFPDGPYVEFLNPSGIDASMLLDRANADLADHIARAATVWAEMSDPASIARIRPDLAPMVPAGKPCRIVGIGAFNPLPCGGTHLASTDAIGALRIVKLKNQKGNLKVSYSVT